MPKIGAGFRFSCFLLQCFDKRIIYLMIASVTKRNKNQEKYVEYLIDFISLIDYDVIISSVLVLTSTFFVSDYFIQFENALI